MRPSASSGDRKPRDRANQDNGKDSVPKSHVSPIAVGSLAVAGAGLLAGLLRRVGSGKRPSRTTDITRTTAEDLKLDRQVFTELSLPYQFEHKLDIPSSERINLLRRRVGAACMPGSCHGCCRRAPDANVAPCRSCRLQLLGDVSPPLSSPGDTPRPFNAAAAAAAGPASLAAVGLTEDTGSSAQKGRMADGDLSTPAARPQEKVSAATGPSLALPLPSFERTSTKPLMEVRLAGPGLYRDAALPSLGPVSPLFAFQGESLRQSMDGIRRTITGDLQRKCVTRDACSAALATRGANPFPHSCRLAQQLHQTVDQVFGFEPESDSPEAPYDGVSSRPEQGVRWNPLPEGGHSCPAALVG